MKVTAIARGYHVRLREPGDVFEVPSGSRAKWFAPVKAVAASGAKAEKTQNPNGEGGAQNGEGGATNESLV